MSLKIDDYVSIKMGSGSTAEFLYGQIISLIYGGLGIQVRTSEPYRGMTTPFFNISSASQISAAEYIMMTQSGKMTFENIYGDIRTKGKPLGIMECDHNWKDGYVSFLTGKMNHYCQSCGEKKKED